MPGFDWLPGVAQAKSFVQLLTGDADGAARTQENFLRECPGVSQLTSVVQAIKGDTDGALETQKRCLGTINNVANGIPVVGHAKGLIHHACGDHEGGNQALNAATRTTVVIGSGAAAGFATGGLGAIPAGIAAGGAYDLVDSAISERPKGIMAAVDNAVNKPNAGNIFDAVAGVAGDGLTGYAGGQIATKLANQSKLSNLEAARDAKNAQMTDTLFPEDNGGTSGQVSSLGAEINALTAQIDAMQLKGPKYFYDVKTKEVVMVEYPTGGSTNVPCMTNHQNSDHRGSMMRAEQENGIMADIYSGEAMDYISKEEMRKHANNYKTQRPSQTSLTETHRYIRPLNQQEFERLDQSDDPERIIKEKRLEQLGMNLWLHLPMPNCFNYTGAGLVNNSFQGFQHTLLRHWDQWMNHIPELPRLLAKLPEISHLLEQIKDASNSQLTLQAENSFNDVLEAIKRKDSPRYAAIRSHLFRAQRMIYRFMLQNMTAHQYCGEGVNHRGLIQVYFRVGKQIMVVCVSKELYPSVKEFDDKRPVRTVTTVFFVTPEDIKNLSVGKVWSS